MIRQQVTFSLVSESPDGGLRPEELQGLVAWMKSLGSVEDIQTLHGEIVIVGEASPVDPTGPALAAAARPLAGPAAIPTPRSGERPA